MAIVPVAPAWRVVGFGSGLKRGQALLNVGGSVSPVDVASVRPPVLAAQLAQDVTNCLQAGSSARHEDLPRFNGAARGDNRACSGRFEALSMTRRCAT
jgi:hypothetical protein